jgi:hypothetical protein
MVPTKEEAMKRNRPAETLRRTEITIEREVVFTLVEPASAYRALCPQCGGEVLMITAEAASTSVGATRRQFYRWLDEKRFHFQESAAGRAYICSVSLDAYRVNAQINGAVAILPPEQPC